MDNLEIGEDCQCEEHEQPKEGDENDIFPFHNSNLGAGCLGTTTGTCNLFLQVIALSERIIYSLGLDMSVDPDLKIAKTITTMRLRLPFNGSMLTRTMLLTAEHNSLKPLFDHFGV